MKSKSKVAVVKVGMKPVIRSKRVEARATPAPPGAVLTDVRELILAARQTVARAVNAALVLLFWKVGERIRKEVLREKRAEYGGEILPTLSAKLVPEFGEGFGARNLARMVKCAEVFPDEPIITSLARRGMREFDLNKA